MSLKFGTDGVRTRAEDLNLAVLTNIVESLLLYHKTKKSQGEGFASDQDVDTAKAAAQGSMRDSRQGGQPAAPRFFIAGDTRESTERILSDLANILAERGVDFVDARVLPTAGIDEEFYHTGCDFAIAVTASHNLYVDNGLKIFERGEKMGTKLSEAGREIVEKRLTELPDSDEQQVSQSSAVQNSSSITAKSSQTLVARSQTTNSQKYIDSYFKHLVDYVGEVDFSELKVGLDLANGATSVLAEHLKELLPKAEIINADANFGKKINHNCGSTHLEQLQKLVKTQHLDLGAAFDGDGDRCLLVDANGEIVDGDQILIILAQFLHLDHMVATVMANQGLIECCKDYNINLEISGVGDQQVAALMQTLGATLGGEQSGHIILPDQPMGDGVLTALMVMKAMQKTGKTLAELARVMTKFPQVMINFSANAAQKNHLGDSAAQQLIKSAEQALAAVQGRLLVRPSGTEDIVRVTMWGEDAAIIEQLAQQLADDLQQTLANSSKTSLNNQEIKN